MDTRTGWLDVVGTCEPWPAGDRNLSSLTTLLCFPSPRCCKTWTFSHTHNLQSASSSCPPFLFHPPLLVDLCSAEGLWHPPPGPEVMWLPPTTLTLPYCHHGNISILTNVPWHLWPSSPICNPISFSHPIIFPPSCTEFVTVIRVTLLSVIPALSFFQFSVLCLSSNVSFVHF